MGLSACRHVETQGFMRHKELLVAPHRVIPAQAGIQTHPQRTSGQSVHLMVTDYYFDCPASSL
jgi:hypothetical protein